MPQGGAGVESLMALAWLDPWTLGVPSWLVVGRPRPDSSTEARPGARAKLAAAAQRQRLPAAERVPEDGAPRARRSRGLPAADSAGDPVRLRHRQGRQAAGHHHHPREEAVTTVPKPSPAPWDLTGRGSWATPDTHPHPHRAAGPSALSAATVPGSQVPWCPSPSSPQGWGGEVAGASAPTFHAPLPVHSPPTPLACRGLQGGTPNPMPSGAPSAKGRVGTL